MEKYTKVSSLTPLLNDQIQGLQKNFPVLPEVMGTLLSGSCARGEATYRSDIDLLVILKSGPLNYGRVVEIRDKIEYAFKKLQHLLHDPLEVQLTVVLASVFKTEEPGMREVLRTARIFFDPEGLIRKEI